MNQNGLKWTVYILSFYANHCPLCNAEFHLSCFLQKEATSLYKSVGAKILGTLEHCGLESLESRQLLLYPPAENTRGILNIFDYFYQKYHICTNSQKHIFWAGFYYQNQLFIGCDKNQQKKKLRYLIIESVLTKLPFKIPGDLENNLCQNSELLLVSGFFSE